MSKDFENFAARAAPAIFVVLWSTGFIGTKYVLDNAEPLTYLAIRMVVVVGADGDHRCDRAAAMAGSHQASATASSRAFWCTDFISAAPRSRSRIRFRPGCRR